MIIVSQDKKKAINSNAIQIINIFQNQLWAGNMPNNQLGDFDTVLGTYKTQERAEEVLQEIITRYANWENMKVGQPSGICSPVYYMPED